MDIAAWATVSRLLDEALALPPSDRDAWIDGLAPEYDAIRPRLRQLLAGAGSIDAAFLDTIPKVALTDHSGSGWRRS